MTDGCIEEKQDIIRNVVSSLLRQWNGMDEIGFAREHGAAHIRQRSAASMAYIGNAEWIEADPGLGYVFRARVPVDNEWFKMPVQIMRWQQLESEKTSE